MRMLLRRAKKRPCPPCKSLLAATTGRQVVLEVCVSRWALLRLTVCSCMATFWWMHVPLVFHQQVQLIVRQEDVAMTIMSKPPKAVHGLAVLKNDSVQVQQDWRRLQNRTMALVHVGKAGGVTVRKATRLVCSGTPEDIRRCMTTRFPPTAVISRQVFYALHMHDLQLDRMDQVTTFLVVLRNPIDRIISAWKYSHPGNCVGPFDRGQIPGGCHLVQAAATVGSEAYTFYNVCFPIPAMEDFAQSVLAPFPPFGTGPTTTLSTNNNNKDTIVNATGLSLSLSPRDIAKCRQLAFSMIRGYGPGKLSPHMYYNYGYYWTQLIDRFLDKEVFAIRTEQAWDDLKVLDRDLGGPGIFRREGDAQRHGSEKFVPAPLSSEAMSKLCCVLEAEIFHYHQFLTRAINLNAAVVAEAMDSIRIKCHITIPWNQWYDRCRNQVILQEQAYLQPEEQEQQQLAVTT